MSKKSKPPVTPMVVVDTSFTDVRVDGDLPAKVLPVATSDMAVAPVVPTYCVLSEVNVAKLCERVQALMAEGWTVQGGLVVAEYHEPTSGRRMPGYHQAMVRQ